jgi:serine/threonine-protein kinase
VGEDYFVMELLEGRTLQQLLLEVGRLDPEAACGILAPVARALDYAHSQGAIHRDVKPANVMIAPDGRPTVMDFGVVHLVSGSITGTGQVFGSPFYMAPEQISQSGASPQTDIFSLGVVAYEALTGRKPFEGEGITPILYHVVHTEPRAPSSLNPRPRPITIGSCSGPGQTPQQFPRRRRSWRRFTWCCPRGAASAAGARSSRPVADPADRVETGARPRGPAIQGGRPAEAAGSRRALAAAAIARSACGASPDWAPSPAPGLSITTSLRAPHWLDGEQVGTTSLF